MSEELTSCVPDTDSSKLFFNLLLQAIPLDDKANFVLGLGRINMASVTLGKSL